MVKVGVKPPLKGGVPYRVLHSERPTQYYFHLFLFGAVSLLCLAGLLTLLLDDPGTWCERAVKVHPFPTLKAALLDTCEAAQTQHRHGKPITQIIYCNLNGSLAVKMKIDSTWDQVREAVMSCVQRVGKYNLTRKDSDYFSVINLTSFMSTFKPDAVSRNRRSLVDSHSPFKNKWLILAHYTVNKTGVQTPCWVCSFRPHYADEMPTTVPIPVNATEQFCMLHYRHVDSHNFTNSPQSRPTPQPRCQPWSEYGDPSNGCDQLISLN